MNTKLIPAPIDDKNVLTDWITEIFDDYDCTSDGYRMFTGFILDSACSCRIIGNLLFWQIHQEFAADAGRSYDTLLKRLKEHDSPPLVVKYDTSMKKEALILVQKFYWTDE